MLPETRNPFAWASYVTAAAEGPMTRADCIDAPRPCPLVSCRYHLLVDVAEARARLVTARPFRENDIDSIVRALHDMPATCALDVADLGGLSLPEIGPYIGKHGQRAHVAEVNARRRLRQLRIVHALRREVDDE